MYRHMADAPSARGLVTSEPLADGRVVEIGEEQRSACTFSLKTVSMTLSAIRSAPVFGTVCSLSSSGNGAVYRTLTF